jgi:hypothetical protein
VVGARYISVGCEVELFLPFAVNGFAFQTVFFPDATQMYLTPFVVCVKPALLHLPPLAAAPTITQVDERKITKLSARTLTGIDKRLIDMSLLRQLKVPYLKILEPNFRQHGVPPLPRLIKKILRR